MEIDRLIGADASLYKATFGTTQTTGATTAKGLYKIVTISGATVFGNANFKVGDIVPVASGVTFTASNSAQLATFTPVLDCNGFSFSITKDEVEITTLTDEVKKYRVGKADMSGEITGINSITDFRTAGGFINRFLRTVDTTSTYTNTLNALVNTPLYIKAYLNDSTASGEYQAYLLGQVNIGSFNLGAAIADAQSYTASIRFVGNDPILITEANA